MANTEWIKTGDLKTGYAYVDLEGNVMVYLGRKRKTANQKANYEFYAAGAVLVIGSAWKGDLAVHGKERAYQIALAAAKEYMKIPFSENGVFDLSALSNKVWLCLGEVCPEEYIKRFLTQGKLTGHKIPDVNIGVSTLDRTKAVRDPNLIYARNLKVGTWYVKKSDLLRFNGNVVTNVLPVLYLGRTESGKYIWGEERYYRYATNKSVAEGDLSTEAKQVHKASTSLVMFKTQNNLQLYPINEAFEVGLPLNQNYKQVVTLTGGFVDAIEDKIKEKIKW